MRSLLLDTSAARNGLEDRRVALTRRPNRRVDKWGVERRRITVLKRDDRDVFVVSHVPSQRRVLVIWKRPDPNRVQLVPDVPQEELPHHAPSITTVNHHRSDASLDNNHLRESRDGTHLRAPRNRTIRLSGEEIFRDATTRAQAVACRCPQGRNEPNWDDTPRPIRLRRG
jgi:hypothetical protein